MIFRGFWMDFGMIFGCFSDDFGCFSKKLRICKNIEKTLVFTVFCKGRPLEKQQKISKKQRKIYVNFEWKKKGLEVA